MKYDYIVVVAQDDPYQNPDYPLTIAFDNAPRHPGDHSVFDKDGNFRPILTSTETYDTILDNAKYNYVHQFWNKNDSHFAGFFTKHDADVIVDHCNNHGFNCHAKAYTIHDFKEQFKWSKEGTIYFGSKHHSKLTLADGGDQSSQFTDKDSYKSQQLRKALKGFKQPIDDRYILVGAAYEDFLLVGMSYYQWSDDTRTSCWRNADGTAKIAWLDETTIYDDVLKDRDYWFSASDARKLQAHWSHPFDNHIRIMSYKHFAKRFRYMKYPCKSSQWRATKAVCETEKNPNVIIKPAVGMTKKSAVVRSLKAPLAKLKNLDVDFDDTKVKDLHTGIAQVHQELADYLKQLKS